MHLINSFSLIFFFLKQGNASSMFPMCATLRHTHNQPEHDWLAKLEIVSHLMIPLDPLHPFLVCGFKTVACVAMALSVLLFYFSAYFSIIYLSTLSRSKSMVLVSYVFSSVAMLHRHICFRILFLY